MALPEGVVDRALRLMLKEANAQRRTRKKMGSGFGEDSVEL